MTEITRVPLQPIAKGALGKLWLGVAAAVLAAGGLAWATLPPSVTVEVVKAGTGPSPTIEDVALINYKGKLHSNGEVFDEGKQAVMPVEGVVPGFSKALRQMQRGGSYKVFIPAKLAYGEKANGPIPANSDLDFEVELLDFRSRAEVEAQMRAMQQQMQAQGGAGGAGVPGGRGDVQLPPNMGPGDAPVTQQGRPATR